ncbi:MAG: hypothetical protein LBU22_14910 [Dysgonamonadaceae bacterium]|jgi:hypothetical protein|nr:hypothetical protein [Dysgonamonadaceae bacterium]
MTNFRKIIVEKLLEKIPPHIKPINYLMEVLDISKESMYRRLRGDISFTLEEMTKLSVELKFSLDELVRTGKEGHTFFNLSSMSFENPSDAFHTMLHMHYQCLENIINGENPESFITVNNIQPIFTVHFDQLFRFLYYRWMHQSQEASLKYHYSDIEVPKETAFLQQQLKGISRKIKNATFIFNANIFENLMQEIHYYYKRKLIDEETLQMLKKEMLDFVNLGEETARTGSLDPGTKINFYLSHFNIETNSYYHTYNNKSDSCFFLCSIEPVITSDSRICVKHRKKLSSLKKYSSLISQSNEILQARYFNQQRAYIENINNMPPKFL